MMDEKKAPEFSILVPVYNVEKYLDSCIDSVLKQTYRDYELILVDDGSKDGSGRICDSFGAKYPNIHVFHKENRGLLHTRRFGIEKATGKYVVFLDSDDMLFDNALERIHEMFEKYRSDVVMYGWARLKEGKIVDSVRSAEKEVQITDKHRMYMKCFCNYDYNSLCIKACRATVFHDFDYSEYYGLQNGEDLLQTIEILKNAESFVLIPDLLYHYRQNDESITRTYSYDGNTAIRECVTRFLEEENLLTEQDWKMYFNHCAAGLAETVLKINRFIPEKEKRLDIYKSIKESEFYRQLIKRRFSICDIGKGSIILKLFTNGMYGLLHRTVKLYDAVR